ncbi:MAG: HipA domain-containing protein [Betaproteobacteria bacterium]|nr:HipA domain-containing protein [Betaproteobacteria bacterium]
MTRLEVRLDQDLVGWLAHDGATNRFSFDYTPQWRAEPRSFPITPRIPLEPVAGQTPESHSAEVRQFFENLLPEGEALDHAAQANGISKSNLVGLMVALGKETAGALRLAVAREDAHAVDHEELRLVTKKELSERIRQRAELPFSVWDGKVRLSIAGYQDKIAIYQRGDEWYLVEGPRLASTVILKPMPARPQLAALPDNEYLCMQLAQRSGLDVAATQLVHVPEPVLFVRRFDRVEQDHHVRRLHIIDGCQALGLSASMKYERPYGDGRDVRNIRDGATYAKLFSLLGQSPQPARDRQALLRWVIFQVLIGNTDAHGKNISFFCGVEGLRLAPFYDLVCIPALGHGGLSSTYAMAIGDAFTEAEVTPFEWASFARECDLPLRMVSNELERLAVRILDQLPGVEKDARLAGVQNNVIASVHSVIAANCLRHAKMADQT